MGHVSIGTRPQSLAYVYWGRRKFIRTTITDDMVGRSYGSPQGDQVQLFSIDFLSTLLWISWGNLLTRLNDLLEEEHAGKILMLGKSPSSHLIHWFRHHHLGASEREVSLVVFPPIRLSGNDLSSITAWLWANEAEEDHHAHCHLNYYEPDNKLIRSMTWHSGKLELRQRVGTNFPLWRERKAATYVNRSVSSAQDMCFHFFPDHQNWDSHPCCCCSASL